MASKHGQLAVFLCAVLWSTSGLFIKLLDWHPILIAGARSLVAGFFMLLLTRTRRTRQTKKPHPFVFWAGSVSYAATMLLFVIANKLTASANAILLQYSAPVWAALFGWALAKERPRREHWLALVVVMAGLVLFFRDGLTGGSLLGDLLAVISGILFGLNSVFMRMNKEGEPADIMMVSHFLTAAFALPFCFMYTPALTLPNMAAVLFMGIFQIGFSSVLFGYGVKHISAVQAMLTAMIEPVLNPVWVLLVTGEKPSLSALAGGCLIIGAVVVSSVIIQKNQYEQKVRCG
ncbi:MAG: DMT family transporter [Spirochaetaceae bacterium]|jgi:drug/metabolite transporter (DMT)-like permease|nr:DMT family transporter [Spirochaetaceae bacterium]